MVFATSSGANAGLPGGQAIGGTLYYGTTTAWISVATGGNAAALQTEVDAIETSLGAGIGSDGTFSAAGFNENFSILGGAPTSFTDAINKLATYADANNTLAELDDVSLTTPLVSGEFLRYNGSAWTDSTISLNTDLGITITAAKINQIGTATFTESDLNKLNAVTASAAELNVLKDIPGTLTSVELGYVDGVTSSIQTQLNDKQALDATLTALAAFNTNGIVVQTAADTFAGRSLSAPAAGITITNADGVAGNPTFALANDLAALEGLATFGIIARTTDGTATTRTITGTAGNISVTNGDGVLGEPTLDLVTVTQASTGSFVKVTLDNFGRVTGNTAVVTSDITTLVDATYVNVSGDTMTGNLVMGTNYVTMSNAPTEATHAVNKAYVDAFVNGLTWKTAVDVATTTNGTLATAFAAGETVDGVTLTAGMRILLKNQTAAAENGIYVVQASGAPVRAEDMNAAAEFDGAAVFVKLGTAHESDGFTQTATVATVGTDAVAFSQFSGSDTYTFGDGLSLAGNTISVNMGAGIIMLPSDEVGIDVATGKAVQLTSELTGGQLTLVLHDGSILPLHLGVVAQ
jgi:hypothetical protein